LEEALLFSRTNHPNTRNAKRGVHVIEVLLPIRGRALPICEEQLPKGYGPRQGSDTVFLLQP